MISPPPLKKRLSVMSKYFFVHPLLFKKNHIPMLNVQSTSYQCSVSLSVVYKVTVTSQGKRFSSVPTHRGCAIALQTTTALRESRHKLMNSTYKELIFRKLILCMTTKYLPNKTCTIIWIIHTLRWINYIRYICTVLECTYMYLLYINFVF